MMVQWIDQWEGKRENNVKYQVDGKLCGSVTLQFCSCVYPVEQHCVVEFPLMMELFFCAQQFGSH
jgi:hypothetical protein